MRISECSYGGWEHGFVFAILLGNGARDVDFIVSVWGQSAADFEIFAAFRPTRQWRQKLDVASIIANN